MWRSIKKLSYPSELIVFRSALFKSRPAANDKLSIETALRPKENCTSPKLFERKSSGDRSDYGEGTKRSGGFNFVKNDCFEAFGWSGIIFLSWYMLFPCCPRRISSNPAERYAFKSLSSFTSRQEYASLVRSLSFFILESPAKYVLPKVTAAKSRRNSFSEASQSEVLKNGCDNLESAHKKVTSSLSNWLGTECMQSGKYQEAYSHFSEAALSNHAAALFNLGLCHEMGLGAKQSFKRAAELYKKAADLGHATAMYNLGVFHVHGWGGVESNSVQAHYLFLSAAELGQADAKRALDWEDDQQSDSDSPQNNHNTFYHDVIEPKDNDITELWLTVLNIKLDNITSEATQVSKSEHLSSIDSGVNDLSPANDIERFFLP